MKDELISNPGQKTRPGLRVLARERDGYPLISGHRGAAAYAPENTMPAFEAGLKRGADLLELDVQLSRDGEVVVIHDWTVDRTTDGRGPVGDMTLAEIKKLDAGSWFGPSFAGVEIPTLDEVAAWAQGQIGLNVEMKSGPHPHFYPDLPEKVVDILRKYDLIESSLVISFDHILLREVKILEPRLAGAINYTARVVDPVRLAADAGADILNVHRGNISPDFVKLAHDNGLAVQCFCDDPDEAVYFARMGVDLMDADHPDIVRNAVRAERTRL